MKFACTGVTAELTAVTKARLKSNTIRLNNKQYLFRLETDLAIDISVYTCNKKLLSNRLAPSVAKDSGWN